MGFRLDCVLSDLEYRGKRSGVGRESGKPWLSLVLEDAEAQQIEVSVPQDLQSDVYALNLMKCDVLTVAVRAVAYNGEGANSYIQLRAVPEITNGVDDDTPSQSAMEY